MILYVLIFSLAAVILNLTLPLMAGLYIVSDLGGSAYLTSYAVSFFCIGNMLGLPLGKPNTTPLSGIHLYVVCLSLMSFFSWQCAIATDYLHFILFRFFEGFASGPLFILIAHTLIPLLSEQKSKTYISSLLLICFSAAPVIGAAYGGWIAYNYHWRMLFYSNIPLCLFLIVYVGYQYRTYHYPYQNTQFDKVSYFFYLITLIFIGTALTVGQELDWFRSPLINFLLIGGGLSLVFFILNNRQSPCPILDFKLLGSFYFCFAMLNVSLFFSVYFGMVILLGLWLKLYVNYTPNWIALIVAIMALGAWIPIFINKKQFDPRHPLAIALLFFAISCFYTTHFNVDINFNRIAFSRILAGVGLALFLTPLFRISIQIFPEEKTVECLCFFHVFRLFGSGIGAALFVILWHRRQVFYEERLGSSLTAFSPVTDQFFARAQQFHLQGKQALAQLNFYLNRQATSLALDDCFYLMAWITTFLLLFLLLTFFFRAPFWFDQKPGS